MPRDDLSIDFVVKMPQQESADPAQILDDFFYRFQNIPEEIRFIQTEMAEKDKQVNECLRIIEDRDGKIQKWIKANGSHTPNPKEESLRTQIRENYAKAERLSDEKLSLSRHLQQLYDRHVIFIDRQIKGLYDRAEPGFLDPDDLPSLLRPSASNQTAPLSATNPAYGSSTASLPATPVVTLQNATVPILKAIPPTMRSAQSQQHAASAPATPAASIMLSHKVRESSAGPGVTIPKRGPRTNLGLANTPTTSSGLARHSSLGPGGTTKAMVATGVGGPVRAGSAGPRSATTKASSTAGGSRKGTPGAPGRKKTLNPGPKSSLSRVKKASSKNSPVSTVESDLSEAESGSAAEGSQSDAAASTKRGSQRAASGTPVPGSQNQKNKDGNKDDKQPDGDEETADAEDDDAGDDKKYCSCQNVSFGDMVACDNDDCPYEWFHWSCVGLKGAPNGTWFCPKCRNNDKKIK
jgi:inhibitor of growth protein 3